MAKNNNIQSYKYQQREFNNQKGRKRIKPVYKNLISKIKDKYWYLSLTDKEKYQVDKYWAYFEKNDNYYNNLSYTFAFYEDDIIEGESAEDFCKRKIPGCPNKKRELKINSILR